jgi:hypothetical protein
VFVQPTPATRSACAGKVANSPACAGGLMLGSGIFSKLARTRLNEDEDASAGLLEIDNRDLLVFCSLDGRNSRIRVLVRGRAGVRQ